MSDAQRPANAGEIERKEEYLARVSHVQMGLAPRNFEEGLRMAELLARSTLVPNDFRGNPGNVLIAIQMGMEVGLPPMQALQSIAVINGRPSLWGDGLLALVQSAPVFEWIEETAKDGIATCTVKRKGWPNPVARTFSVDDAKKANLWNKQGPWQTNPNRMLQMRARAFALRDVFADVLRGLSSAEEMLDVTPITVTTEKPDPALMMRNDLNCSEAQYAQIVDLWDSLKVAQAQRIVQAKKYAGRAVELAQMLIDMGAPLPVPAAIAAPEPEPRIVTKPQRRRLAKAQAEATAPVVVAPAVAESIADAMGPDTGCCEHGVVAGDSCEACVALANELDAEAAAVVTTVAPPETPQQYAARKKRELEALNAPKVAPPETEPF